MLNARNKRRRSRSLSRMSAPRSLPRENTVDASKQVNTQSVNNHSPSMPMKTSHVLTDAQENTKLYAYESSVRESFDTIVSTLKKISALQHEKILSNRLNS